MRYENLITVVFGVLRIGGAHAAARSWLHNQASRSNLRNSSVLKRKFLAKAVCQGVGRGE